MAVLDVVSISKAFGGVTVLRHVSFHAGEGEIVCLLGPSGCGKTTMLRIVAGLETADAGTITLDGQRLAEVAVHRRGFGLMFQDFALFPHKDVATNVAFGLQMQGLPSRQVQARVAEMLDLVGLTGYERRRVYDLSGGEQQRVALARSLAPGPRLLMLDEPLGSLDRALREELLNELRAILKRVGVTTLYVTHDQQEAFAIADRVLIMNHGQIVQQGTPQQVYGRPASAWVARFLGLANLLPGRVAADELGQVMVDTALGRLALAAEGPMAAGQAVTVLIRPEAARPAGGWPGDDGLAVEGTVSESSFRGGHVRLVVRPGAAAEVELAFELVAGTAELPGQGEAIRLVLRTEAISLLAGAEEGDGQATGR
jgi:ABC-type Fe3+/spermidine/putrescine transport system ATPase subunit